MIVCSHIGGQFNETPGTYSRFMADFVLEHGADMLIGNHPHVIQKTRIETERLLLILWVVLINLRVPII